MYKVKELMNKITDKGSTQNQNSGPGSGAGGGGDSLGHGGSGGPSSICPPDEQDSAEGFLCPVCMTAFSSQEVLTEHYTKFHDENNIKITDDSDIQSKDEDEAAAILTLLQLQQEISDGNYDHLNSLDVNVKSRNTGVCGAAIKVAAEAGKKLLEERSTNSILNEALEQVVQKIQSEEEEKLNLTTKISNLEDELKWLQKGKDSSSREIQTDNHDKELIETLKNDAANCAQEKERICNELSMKESKFTGIINEKDKLIQKLEQTLKDKETEQKKLRTEFKQIEKEKDSLITKLKKEFNDATQNHDLEKRTLEDELKIITSTQSTDVQANNERICKLEREIKIQTHANDVQRRFFKETLDNFSQFVESHINLSSKFQSNTDSKLSCFSEKLDGVPAKVIRLKEKIVKFIHENKQLNEKINTMDQELKNSNEKSKQMELNIDLLKQKHESEKEDLNNQFNSKLTNLKRELSESCAILKKSQQTSKEEFTDHISKCQTEKQRLSTELQKYIQLVTKRLTEHQKFKEETHLTQETYKKQTEEKLNEIMNNNTEILSKLKVTQKEAGEMREILNKLEDEKSNLVKQIDQTLENHKIENNMKEVMIEKLKDDFKIVESTCRENVEGLERALKESEALKIELGKSHQDFQKLQAQYEESTKTYESMSNELTESKTKIKQLEDEFNNLKAIKLEIEKKFKISEEGKALLLERCLSGENETEKLQETLQDLRRKLDDSFSALQELGRENQSLQMESAKLQGRKWADDAVVNACQNVPCAKEFSLTIRKHHCRQCGNIFCSECSSKTASIPSSKKPVRVCDPCYEELISKSK